jgi:hypothetical protein
LIVDGLRWRLAYKNALGDLYQGLLAKGTKPAMARLTLARKIAAIVLTIWKKEGASIQDN